MFSLSKILFPTDFSERSMNAAPYAMEMARSFHSQLVVLHVFQPGILSADAVLGMPQSLASVITEYKRTSQEQLGKVLSTSTNILDIKRVLLQGDKVAEQIVDYAHSEHVDLIMVPTRGLGTFRRFIIGSVTAKILHDAQCPVWTGVHVEEMAIQHSTSLRTIVCAIELTPENTKVLTWAAELAEAIKAKLIVVHAISVLEYRPDFQYFNEELRRALSEDAKKKIQWMLGESCRPSSEVHIYTSPVAMAVRAAAQDYSADLVVIGRSCGNGVIGRLRSNSYAIIRECPCPVISI